MTPRPPSANQLDKLQEKVKQTIQAHRMCRQGDRILIGVSGGADSLALMYVLYDLAETLSVELGVCYLNHGLRPQAAEKEAVFVQEKATALGLPCLQGRAEINQDAGSVEERARIERYAFFKRTAKVNGYTKIAVGHHMEDNAESVLMHLLRGSGIRGLSGIAPVTHDGIIRPLINCRKADILAFLEAAGHTHMQDESNNDLRFQRNRVRHDVMPYLEQNFHPKVIETLNRTAALCREEEQWLQNRASAMIAELKMAIGPGSVALDLENLNRQARPMQRRIIREVLRQWQGHLKRLTAAHVESIIDMAFDENKGHGRLDLPNGIRAKRRGDQLTFTKTPHPRRRTSNCRITPYCYTIASIEDLPIQLDVTEAGCRLHFSIFTNQKSDSMFPAENQAVFFDLQELAFPLSIRNRRAGDRIHPFGLQGSQKLKQLLNDRKIAPSERDRLPLLVSGEDIVWVVGIRRATAAPVTAYTAQTLYVSVDFIHKSKKLFV